MGAVMSTVRRKKTSHRKTHPRTPHANVLSRLDDGRVSEHMDEDRLATYLDEHLAGAEAAIEITRRLADDVDLKEPMTWLDEQLNEDRDVLQEIRSRLPASEGLIARTVGLVGGMLAHVRDRSPLAPAPSRMEDLEALAIGVWGKRLLWGTLARVAECEDAFRDIDVDSLIEGAEEQEKKLLRLRADATESELQLN